MGLINNTTVNNTTNIRQLTNPSGPIVSLSDQKLFSRIDGSYEDALIESLIQASTLQCERFVKSGFLERDYEQTGDYICDGMDIKGFMVSSITSFHIYDIDNNEILLDPQYYLLDRANSLQTARIFLNNPPSYNLRCFTSYKIEYVAGWVFAPDVPFDITLAIKLTTHNWYENRETIGTMPTIAKDLLRSIRGITI